jgi:hypothetical protein
LGWGWGTKLLGAVVFFFFFFFFFFNLIKLVCFDAGGNKPQTQTTIAMVQMIKYLPHLHLSIFCISIPGSAATLGF